MIYQTQETVFHLAIKNTENMNSQKFIVLWENGKLNRSYSFIILFLKIKKESYSSFYTMLYLWILIYISLSRLFRYFQSLQREFFIMNLIEHNLPPARNRWIVQQCCFTFFLINKQLCPEKTSRYTRIRHFRVPWYLCFKTSLNHSYQNEFDLKGHCHDKAHVRS